MIDGAYTYLIDQLRQTPGPALWFAEEGCGDYLPMLATFKDTLRLYSARLDIINAARALSITSEINDARWPVDIKTREIKACFIRIAKEKPWVHHLINQARQHLPPGSRLYLAGHKQEGIKTYAEKAAALFNSQQKAQKNGDFYQIELTQTADPIGILLPCEDYPELRAVFNLREKPVLSKPGIYGWDKIDQGSELLVAVVANESLSTINNCLDLGCGYGYLTLATGQLNWGLRTCTDNNSAALDACAHNCAQFAINAHCVLADCGEGLQEQFDLILCNPPFHQGFNVENQLTQRFLAAAAKRLTPKGAAYFVVNHFIPLERKASDYFKLCELKASNGRFKVLRLAQPKY